MNNEGLIKFLINWFQYSPDEAMDEVEARPLATLEMARALADDFGKDKGINQELKDKIKSDFQEIEKSN